MNGFISESTSKISDGFGTAISILALYFSTRFLHALVERTAGRPGELIIVFILLVMGAVMLVRALTGSRTEEQRADAGLVAGVLLWQALRLGVSLAGNAGFFGLSSGLIWLVLVLAAIVLWRSVLPIGLRFFTLVYLLLWAGTMYIDLLALISGWASTFIVVYYAEKAVALVGVLIFILLIVYHTANSMQRKLCGVGLAFCVLLSLNLF